MRRTVSMIVLGVAMILATTPAALAQDEAMHPVVGTWAMDDGGFAVFHADGTNSAIDPDGHVVYGAWEVTGERTADLLFHFPAGEGELGTARTLLEVSADGATLTGSATIELPAPDGGTTGQLGPVTVTGTRLVVEPQGEPVGPFPPTE